MPLTYALSTFNNILQFSVYKAYTTFVKFIYDTAFFFDAIAY